MKNFILTFLLLIINLTLFGQNNDTWFSFWNEDRTLIGYKDKNGIIKIEPRFTTYVYANKFDNIMVAIEHVNEEWERYYLTKQGRMIGIDSLFIFAWLECENEGFIRFRDPKTDKAGMFNKNGDIAIPAEYSELTRVRNGMIIALKDDKRMYWEDENYYPRPEGTELLIDTLNNILIDNFPYDDNCLNFFSVEITKEPHSDPMRKSFLARDGNYYSFVEFEKEFKYWLTNDLLSNLTSQNLINASYATIYYWDSYKEGWTKSNRREFINNNFEVLKTDLLEILNSDSDYFILRDELSERVEYEKYFNNCGQLKTWIYPVMDIFTSRKSNRNIYEFLRTDEGYKLIRVTISDKKLK